MCRTTTGACSVAAVAVCLLCGCPKEAPQKAESPRTATVHQAAPNMQTGEELFRQFCNNCHPDGGNVSDPKRSLHGSALRKNRITQPEDIIRIMRNPLSRMIRFDEEAISDKDARTIAEYVLSTFR